MLNLIINISRFVYIFLILLFLICGWHIYKSLPSQRKSKGMATYQSVIILLFNILSDMIIILRTIYNEGDLTSCLIWLGIAAGGLLVMHILTVTLHKGTSRLLWNNVFMLLSISIVILWRLNSSIAHQQIRWMIVCFGVVNIILLIMRGEWIYKIPVAVFIVLNAVLIILPFLFPSYSGGSLNWANIHNFVFQPSEFVKISFVFFLAYLYSRKLNFRSLLIATCMTGFMGIVLLKQNDLGGLLIFCIVYWLMTYEYLGNSLILWAGVIVVGLAGFLAYKFVSHVQVRIDAWINPWADISNGGYQIAHSLFAIVGGGWLGSGLYKGMPTYIPVNTTDMIFSAVAEEFGGLFAIFLIGVYGIFFLTILQYAVHEQESHKRSLLLGFAILLMTQTFVIIGGVIKLIPLTGVTLPFISYGGSSMLSMFALIGVVQGIIRSSYAIRRKEDTYERQTKKSSEYQTESSNDTKNHISVPFEF